MQFFAYTSSKVTIHMVLRLTFKLEIGNSFSNLGIYGMLKRKNLL